MKNTRVEADKQAMSKTIPAMKPTEIPATRIVLDILLPFLNLNPNTATDADLFREVKAIAERLGDGFSEGWFSNTPGAGRFLNTWEKNQKALAVFRQTLEEGRAIILSASVNLGFTIGGTTSVKFWERVDAALETLEPSASGCTMSTQSALHGLVFPRLSHVVQGALKGSFKTQKEFDGVWIPGVRAIILYYVVTAYQLVETGRKGSISPVGWHYIGLCHKEGCGKIFRKTRSNQEFCSLRCKTAQIQRRRRAKDS